jgi:hypothetical protein
MAFPHLVSLAVEEITTRLALVPDNSDDAKVACPLHVPEAGLFASAPGAIRIDIHDGAEAEPGIGVRRDRDGDEEKDQGNEVDGFHGGPSGSVIHAD